MLEYLKNLQRTCKVMCILTLSIGGFRQLSENRWLLWDHQHIFKRKFGISSILMCFSKTEKIKCLGSIAVHLCMWSMRRQLSILTREWGRIIKRVLMSSRITSYRMSNSDQILWLISLVSLTKKTRFRRWDVVELSCEILVQRYDAMQFAWI